MSAICSVNVRVDYDGNGSFETDISAWAEEVEIEYGRESPLDQFDVGVASVVLDNDDNDFTPGHPEATRRHHRRGVDARGDGRRALHGVG